MVRGEWYVASGSCFKGDSDGGSRTSVAQLVPPLAEQVGTFDLSDEMEEAEKSEDAPLDSVASVQAKLNMLTAVEEEMTGRSQARAPSTTLMAPAPPF